MTINKGLLGILKLPEELFQEGDFVIFKSGVTEERFWEIANEDTNYELIDGVLVIHSPASKEHEEIFGYLFSILNYYVSEQAAGVVLGSRFVMRLSSKWNPEPDMMVVLKDRQQALHETFLDGPANLVVEILSPSTRDMDHDKKVPQYLASGVQEVWLVDPLKKSIFIRNSQEEREYNSPDSDEILESRVLPDLKIHCDWIWNRENNPIHEILKLI